MVMLIKRFVAFLIDVIIIFVIFTVMITIVVEWLYPLIPYVVLSFLCVPFVLKDVFGRSLGKKIMNIKLIDETTGDTPKLWKRICRNLLFEAWFLEGFMLILYPQLKGKKLLDQALSLTHVSGKPK